MSNSATSPTSAYRIGDWTLDPTANQLTRDAEIIRLEPKATEVLMFLVGQPGQVVSREALLAAVWPGMVVGDDALTQSVIKLRKALQDDARAPQYIETISKRGYRLIATVALAGSKKSVSSELRAPVESVIPPRTRARLTVRAASLVALFAAVVAGIATVYWPLRDSSAETDEPAIEKLTKNLAELPTIAVTPFDSVATDAAEAYFARGIAADLSTDLSRLSGLRVIGIQTHPVGGSVGGVSMGSSARYGISGTVQRGADLLRINVQLVDNESGRQLWAERYERPFKNLIAVQDEILHSLLKELPVKVSEAERQRMARRYTRNADAYDFYLRGKAAFLVRQPAENGIAREMYQRAIDLDPQFARAYAGLALTYTNDYRNQWAADGKRSLERAMQLAETALLMDPDIPDMYAILGYVNAVRLDYGKAIKLVGKAISLDPSYADAYAYMGAFFSHIGQPEKAIRYLRLAMRLNPDGGFIYFLVIGRAYLASGDYEQAIINLREAITRNGADIEAHVLMAAALVAAGNLPEASWEAEEIRALQPAFATRQWLQTYPMTDTAQKKKLISLLATLGF